MIIAISANLVNRFIGHPPGITDHSQAQTLKVFPASWAESSQEEPDKSICLFGKEILRQAHLCLRTVQAGPAFRVFLRAKLPASRSVCQSHSPAPACRLCRDHSDLGAMGKSPTRGTSFLLLVSIPWDRHRTGCGVFVFSSATSGYDRTYFLLSVFEPVQAVRSLFQLPLIVAGQSLPESRLKIHAYAHGLARSPAQ